MKAILEFDLSEPDDRLDHMIAVRANDMLSVLWELLYNSKKDIEWKIDSEKLSAYDTLDKVYERLTDLLDEHALNIDKLMQ